MYAEIDKFSNLLWTAKDPNELCNNRGGSRRKPDLRSEINYIEKEENSRWERETEATFGYGEITRVSKHSFLIKTNLKFRIYISVFVLTFCFRVLLPHTFR